MQLMKSWTRRCSNVRLIAWGTFLEVIRDKILYNVILCSAILFFVQLLSSGLAVVQPERLTVSLGLTILWISCMSISILIGSALINKEFEKRTIYVILSRPISRFDFMIGKFLGLAAVLKLNWIFISLIYFATLFYTAPLDSFSLFPETISWILILGLIFIFLQSLMIASISIFFSTLTTTSLSVILSIGFLCLGYSVQPLRYLAARSPSEMTQFIMNSVSYIIPNFETFNLGNSIIYGLPISSSHIGVCFFYAFMVVSFFLALSGVLLRLKEI